jgi:hypothetical protein
MPGSIRPAGTERMPMILAGGYDNPRELHQMGAKILFAWWRSLFEPTTRPVATRWLTCTFGALIPFNA